MNVPLAPELGLFLDKAFYDSYNKRWGEERELLELDDFQDQIDAFKVRLPGLRCYVGCRAAVRYKWSTHLKTFIL